MEITGLNQPEAIIKELTWTGQSCCVVTAGDQGCWYSEHAGKVSHFPAFLLKAVDTTGCGDVFHGVYAAAITQNESIPQAIRLATAAAGLKATQPGGRAGIPTKSEIDTFLNNDDFR